MGRAASVEGNGLSTFRADTLPESRREIVRENRVLFSPPNPKEVRGGDGARAGE